MLECMRSRSCNPRGLEKDRIGMGLNTRVLWKGIWLVAWSCLFGFDMADKEMSLLGMVANIGIGLSFAGLLIFSSGRDLRPVEVASRKLN